MTWIDFRRKKPKYTKAINSLGTPVIIYDGKEVKQAFYGVRITNSPTFYLHGAVIHDVRWWMPMPEPPKVDGKIL